jgi:hypothetical protein
MFSRIAAIFACLFASMPAHAVAGEVRVKYSPVEYLKNFALSICVADGYTSEEAKKDSLAAADGYSELGGLPFEAYERAESLARQFLAKTYESASGQSLTLMKCIDLFHSKELDRIARAYSNK